MEGRDGERRGVEECLGIGAVREWNTVPTLQMEKWGLKWESLSLKYQDVEAAVLTVRTSV